MDQQFLSEIDEGLFFAFSDIAEKVSAEKVQYYEKTAFLVEKSFRGYPYLKLYFLAKSLNSGLQIDLKAFYPYAKEINLPTKNFYQEPEFGLFEESFSAQVQIFTSACNMQVPYKEITRVFFRLVGEDQNNELYYFDLGIDFAGSNIEVLNQEEEEKMTIQEKNVDYKKLYEDARRSLWEINYRIGLEREFRYKEIPENAAIVAKMVRNNDLMEEKTEDIFSLFSNLKKTNKGQFARIIEEIYILAELRGEENRLRMEAGLDQADFSDPEGYLLDLEDIRDFLESL